MEVPDAKLELGVPAEKKEAAEPAFTGWRGA